MKKMSKDVEEEKRTMWRYAFGAAMIALGLLANQFGVGVPDFQIMGSVGNWLAYIGLVVILIAAVRQLFKPKKRVIDERNEFVAAKAMRAAFILFIAAAFVIMLVDAVQPITLPIYLFMSYLVCFVIFAYFVAYHVLLRRH